MKIILVRDRGGHRAYSLSRRMLASAALCAIVAVAVSFLAVKQAWFSPSMDDVSIVAWQTRIAEQQAQIDTLSKRSDTQSAAVGKQLAEMRARLLRMEAIGAHMADVAGLDDGEFDFDTPPAQGGPASADQQAVAWADLQLALTELAEQIKWRETQLQILDEVVANEETHSASQVAGRPVTWGWMSSGFGERVDPINGKNAWHSGVDFAGRDGSDVIAVASGVVTFAGERSGYGKMVEVSHADGLVTRYAHQKELAVGTGEIIKKGEKLGTMGSSGRSTGPHVHFEVLKNGRTVDPARYVTKRS